MAISDQPSNKHVRDINWSCATLRQHISNIDADWPTYFSAMIALRLSEVPIEIQRRILAKVDGFMKHGALVTHSILRDLDNGAVDDERFRPWTLSFSPAPHQHTADNLLLISCCCLTLTKLGFPLV